MNTHATIKLPRSGIRDNVYSLQSLARAIPKVSQTSGPLYIDFNQCEFICYSGVALLGAIITAAQQVGRDVYLVGLDESNGGRYLRTNGFTQAIGLENHTRVKSTAVPYRQYSSPDVELFCLQLENDWLTPDRVNVSDGVRGVILNHIAEAFVNVFNHADSSIGAIVCGQWHPNISSLNLAVLDLGVGIPHKVATYLNRKDLSAAQALETAFRQGFTTLADQAIPRGIGLYNLREFVSLNEGKLEVYSGYGYARIDKSEQPFYDSLTNSFPGTLIQFAIQTDARYYMLEEEMKTFF